ncbi:hypothetical protein ACOMHN_011490 [Nucella lapillus]
MAARQEAETHSSSCLEVPPTIMGGNSVLVLLSQDSAAACYSSALILLWRSAVGSMLERVHALLPWELRKVLLSLWTAPSFVLLKPVQSHELMGKDCKTSVNLKCELKKKGDRQYSSRKADMLHKDHGTDDGECDRPQCTTGLLHDGPRYTAGLVRHVSLCASGISVQQVFVCDGP